MKTIITCVLCTVILILGCGAPSADSSDPIKLATKRIKQKIDQDAWGMIEFELFDVEQKDDSVFQATHTFVNPMNKEVKITRLYTLNSGLDSVLSKEKVGPTLMKSEGEWIDSGM